MTNRNKARKTKETAHEAAQRSAKEARSLLIRLNEKVDDLQHDSEQNPKNWLYAGDLGNIRDKALDLLVGFECEQFDGDEDRTRDAIMRSL